METSLEGVDFHMSFPLFCFICLLLIFKSQTMSLCHYFPFYFLLQTTMNFSSCFFPLPQFSNQSFTPLLTSFIHPPFSLNITPGSYLLLTCPSALTEFYMASTSLTSTNPLYFKRSFNMEKTKKLALIQVTPFCSTP
jgi:hypothetical protein